MDSARSPKLGSKLEDSLETLDEINMINKKNQIEELQKKNVLDEKNRELENLNWVRKTNRNNIRTHISHFEDNISKLNDKIKEINSKHFFSDVYDSSPARRIRTDNSPEKQR